MAEETSNSLESKKISTTFRGILHFPRSIDETLAKQTVYDGKGAATSLKLGGGATGAEIDGSLLISNNTTIQSDLNLSGNANLNGNLNLNGGGSINDVIIGSNNSEISTRILNSVEAGKLRIRESSLTTDYEIVFGNPTDLLNPNLFSIKVKGDSGNNLYIKNRPFDNDFISPFWINKTTGEVNIKTLKVANLISSPNTESGFPPGNQPQDSKRNVIPIGSIVMFPSLTIPNGWFECDGREISSDDYPELFGVIEYNYSTVSSGNLFRVPDLRGLFVRGLDHDTSLNGGSVETGRDPTTGRGLNNIQTDEYSNLESSSGESNTRPKNMALVYCIKW